MQDIVLIVHLIIAICLVAVVLLQRSEGGALGIGGGGGGGLVSARGAASALSKVTWGLAIAFICTSITLTILSGGDGTGSVTDDFSLPSDEIEIPLPGLSDSDGEENPLGAGSLLPPATPPAAE
ncbi:MAG: preprotein translocase subunit SecG [Pseudomonadota bacterium]